ncbi:MAG: DnaJ domain-containing protein [Dehalococcoidales bacterium]|nr:DnaJ domain-containing protein [Dehalococcoidales bacterium]
MREQWEIHWKNYYKILQVDPSAEPEVVDGAYIRLAKKYAPDVNKDPGANQRMVEINEAKEVLKDTERRKRYHEEWLRRSGGSNNSNTPYNTNRNADPQRYPHPPSPEPQSAPDKPSEETQLKMCPNCNESSNMKILYVDKIPAYAQCPKCHKLINLRPKANEMSKTEVMRRVEEFLRKNNKRFK